MHLVMVENPDFHAQGDFVLSAGRLYAKTTQLYDPQARA